MAMRQREAAMYGLPTDELERLAAQPKGGGAGGERSDGELASMELARRREARAIAERTLAAAQEAVRTPLPGPTDTLRLMGHQLNDLDVAELKRFMRSFILGVIDEELARVIGAVVVSVLMMRDDVTGDQP